MIFRKQLKPHLPSAGIIGDCLRTCYACLLDLEPSQVPHFAQLAYDSKSEFGLVETPDETRFQNEWLLSQGYLQWTTAIRLEPYETITQALDAFVHLNQAPKHMFMVTGQGPNAAHVCIYKGADLLWDPSPSNAGLIGGIPPQNAIFITVLMPASMRWDGTFPPANEA
jgi:hypothetical protein